ncbi:MAG TPA: alkaline phosphatase family protein [Polyangiaceae bacterium]
MGRVPTLFALAVLVGCGGGASGNASSAAGADGGAGDDAAAGDDTGTRAGGDGSVPPSGDAASDAGDGGDGSPADDGPFAGQRAACAFKQGALPRDTFGPSIAKMNIPIDTVVIVSQENRAFDHYFAHLPAYGQTDVAVESPGVQLANAQGQKFSPFHQTDYCFADTAHDWDSMHADWNGGANDGFVRTNDPGGERTLGTFDQTDLSFYYELAGTYGIGDHYFSALLGPTGPNRLYLYAGTSSGHIANGPGVAPGQPSIFRRLTDAKVPFAVYSASGKAATNCPGPYSFETSMFCGDIPQGASPMTTFDSDAAAGTLPNVSWIYPGMDEHPPEDMQQAERLVQHVFDTLAASPQWPRAAFILTYDEAGGIYDHMPPARACQPDSTPPAVPAEGKTAGAFDVYGFRVPLLVASPWSRAHYVSHEVTSHTSILRFLELRFGLPAVSDRDANEWPLIDYFDFSHPSFAAPHVPAAVVVADPKTKGC